MVQRHQPENNSKLRGLIFEFSNAGADAIFVEAGGPDKLGSLRFGARVPGRRWGHPLLLFLGRGGGLTPP